MWLNFQRFLESTPRCLIAVVFLPTKPIQKLARLRFHKKPRMNRCSCGARLCNHHLSDTLGQVVLTNEEVESACKPGSVRLAA